MTNQLPSSFSKMNKRADARLWPFLQGLAWLLPVAILASLIIPLSRTMAGAQDADGVLTALISVQKITWYFWGQDRFLNFVPALAMPVHDVEWNLRAQIFLRCLFSFLGPVGVLYFFNQSPRFLAFTVVLSNALLIALLGDYASFNLYVQHNPFGTSLVLFALSLYVLRSRFRYGLGELLALVLAMLAYTTNVALVTISLPIIVIGFLARLLPRKELAVFFLINLLSAGLAYTHAKVYGHASTSFGTAYSMEAVRAGYAAVAAQVRWLGFVLLLLGALLSLSWISVGRALPALVLILGCAAIIGVLSCSVWVQLNSYNIRYYLSSILIVVALLAYLCVQPFYARIMSSWHWPVLALMCLLTAWQYGLEGWAPDYNELVAVPWRAHSRLVAKQVVHDDAQLVIGDFWEVWPAVFESYALRGSAGLAHPVYGAAARGYVLRKRLWRASASTNGVRALCFQSEPAACLATVRDQLESPNAEIAAGSLRELFVDGKKMLGMAIVFWPTAGTHGEPGIVSGTGVER